MLKIKKLKIKSFSENIAYINSACQLYDTSKIRSIVKVEITSGKNKTYAMLQIVDDNSIVSPAELALNQEAFNSLGAKEGESVNLALSNGSDSFSLVRKKMYGNVLSQKEYEHIAQDIVKRNYSNTGVSAFLVALGSFMTQEETLSFCKALISKEKINWNTKGIVADYYCVGGLPGNKADFIVLSIIAAYGMLMPKSCSYSLTSCCGVGNVAATLMNVSQNKESFKKLALENNGAMALFDCLEDIGVFNKHISPIEGYIGLLKAEVLVASILAIKISCGITHLLVDIPVGPKVRIRTSQEALRIRKLFEYLGDNLGIKVDVLITDGSEPIGNGLGAYLESRDILKILKNEENCADDLKEKSLFLAGKILDFDPKLRGGQGILVAQEILESGRALSAFNKILASQGKQEPPKMGALCAEITSQEQGTITAIDCAAINYLAILSGTNRYKGCGVDMVKKVGDDVLEDEVLFRIYSHNPQDFAAAKEFVSRSTIYEIG